MAIKAHKDQFSAMRASTGSARIGRRPSEKAVFERVLHEELQKNRTFLQAKTSAEEELKKFLRSRIH
jgi:hypothetical protein